MKEIVSEFICGLIKVIYVTSGFRNNLIAFGFTLNKTIHFSKCTTLLQYAHTATVIFFQKIKK